jgi:DNA-binding transcriptional LysR family regulator
MDMLTAMRSFVRVVEAASFSRAAAALDTQTSAVSRAVAGLEQELGVDLFHRTTRSLHLTEPGARFYRHAVNVLNEVEEARNAVSALQDQPRGLLKLALPDAFARLHIVPHIGEFLARFPDLRLDLSLSDVRVDLISVGADAAVRIGPMLDSALIARKLAPHRRILCASTAYLASHAPIRRPDDLLQHDCLIYSLQSTHNWFFVDAKGKQVAVPVQGRLRADDSEPLRDGALEGLGVVLLPSWLVGDDLRAGRLQRVLHDWQAMIATQPSGIYGLYPPHKAVPRKVKAFLDFLQRKFGRNPYWEAGLT